MNSKIGRWLGRHWPLLAILAFIPLAVWGMNAVKGGPRMEEACNELGGTVSGVGYGWPTCVYFDEEKDKLMEASILAVRNSTWDPIHKVWLVEIGSREET